jgi:hypothetical protein
MSNSSSGHLQLLNAVIGFCKNAPWVHPLADLGYEVEWLGPRFDNGHGAMVNPDAILVSTSLNHALITDCKSGSTIDLAKLRDYCAVTARSLLQFASITTTDPFSLSHDVWLVCDAESVLWITQQLESENLAIPVVSVGSDQVQLVHGSFSLSELNEAFRQPLSTEGVPPPEYIPYDGDSDVFTTARVVLPHIVQYMSEERAQFSADDLILSSLQSYSSALADKEKQRIRTNIRKVLSAAAKLEWKGVIRRKKGSASQVWRILKNPFKRAPAQKARGLQALARAQDQFLARLSGGALPPELEILPDQLTFLDESDDDSW